MDRAEAALAAIERGCDRINDATDADIDNQRVGGMITITFRNGSQMIVNLQKPLQEIWLAARSGGYHYRHDGQRLGRHQDGRGILRQAVARGDARRPGRRCSSRPTDAEAPRGSVAEQVEDAVALFRRRRRADRRRRPSTSAGGVGAGVDAQARDAAARRVVVVVPLAADLAPRPSGAGSSATGTPLQRGLHVADPDRQAQAAAGFRVAQLARRVVADPGHRRPCVGWKPANQASSESLVVPVLP